MTSKPPCPRCGGPAGECSELRGGYLPQLVCKAWPHDPASFNAGIEAAAKRAREVCGPCAEDYIRALRVPG